MTERLSETVQLYTWPTCQLCQQCVCGVELMSEHTAVVCTANSKRNNGSECKDYIFDSDKADQDDQEDD